MDNAHDDHVPGLGVDVLHVFCRSSYVLGGYIAAAHGFDIRPEGSEERFGFVLVRITEDDRFPTPKVKAARGSLADRPSCQA